ncbi:ABC transporter substrate-binding protein [Peterkaempfera griseoplana]|uniref:ABC transporter substrate-binding protein n=1 Tax=Peterkaempfera griseoplana TaxID=66896 RepID=UPI0006E45CC0|nr:ABC transporter substrate-binding protein [Peterkaempfera griseoplana]
MPHPLSRRGLLAAGGALGAGALLSACGSTGTTRTTGAKAPDASSAAPGTANGPWSYTDDRGTKVTARTTPRRIVAFTGTAAALVDLGLQDRIVGVFGETIRQDGSPSAQAGDLDVRKVTVLGNVWGEFGIEKYAALNPELLVTHTYDAKAPGLWYVPDESRDRILKLAPAVAVDVGHASLPVPIQRYADLARSLGADLTAKRVTDARTRFEQAAETVRRAAKASGGLKVMACSGSADILYVSKPASAADLRYFTELGVRFVVPEKTDGGDYYESLSWENAGKYHADLLLLDSRSTSLQPGDLASKPAWNDLPAVRAGQIAGWDAVPRFSWAGSAPLLENLAKALSGARRLG